MMYKIQFHQAGGNFTITLESKALRPVTAYKDDMQMESNTVYAVVTDDSEGNLIMRLLDMSAPRNMRGLFLIIVLKNNKLGIDITTKVADSFTVGTNLFGNMSGVGPAHKEMAAVIFEKIWRKGISKLFSIIKDLQALYCKDQQKTKHTPWLKGITITEIKIFSEVIALKVGKK